MLVSVTYYTITIHKHLTVFGWLVFFNEKYLSSWCCVLRRMPWSFAEGESVTWQPSDVPD